MSQAQSILARAPRGRLEVVTGTRRGCGQPRRNDDKRRPPSGHHYTMNALNIAGLDESRQARNPSRAGEDSRSQSR